MPLLRRQPFAKQKPPPDLKPDEEVFFCQLTGEIFRDYEKFFERIILCNSLVWTCAITGKPGLTYQEALESEQKAKKQLASFPDYLQRPILYLASLTHRSRLNDLNDDVFLFAKGRYFINEIVEVTLDGDRKSCKIIKVIAPEDPSKPKVNGSAGSIIVIDDSDSDSVVCLDENPKGEKSGKANAFGTDPHLYQYVVHDVRNSTSLYVVKPEQIRRKKGLFSRDRSKLYLKQHCDSFGDGVWKVKDRYIRKFKLESAKFTDYFAGPLPSFLVSKAKKKPQAKKSTTSGEEFASKKERKKMKKQLEKEKKSRSGEDTTPEKPIIIDDKKVMKMTAEEREQLKEQIRVEKEKMREERKRILDEEKQKRKEERAKERDKLREEKRQRDEELKEWSRPRDDLECDDLQDLPCPTPVQTHIPAELFGDVVMVQEFIHSFRDIFDLQNEFQNGVNYDDFCNALLSRDNNGLYCDLLRVLLTAIFTLQEDELEDEEIDEEEETETTGKFVIPEGSVSMQDHVKAATAAAQLIQWNYSNTLSKLPLDGFTLTEILRLHFLSSGARGSENSLKFRYQQRGGYSSLDDAGLEFKMYEREIVKNLGMSNVFDQPPGNKLKIITVLTSQLLSYMGCRDVVEESMEKLRVLRYELKQHQWAEHRRDREEAAFWWRKRMEERNKEKEAEAERKAQMKNEKEEKLRLEENKEQESPETSEDKKAKEKPVAPISEAARKNTRQKDKDQVKEKEHIEKMMEGPVENIDWEKITPEDRVKMKNKYLEEETKMMDALTKLQACSAIYPIGRDRLFQRYWVFPTMPGLFVENQEEHIPEDFFVPVPHISIDSGEQGMKEEKSTGSDKENESFESKADNVGNQEEKMEIDTEEAKPFVATQSIQSMLSKTEKVKWAFYKSEGEIDSLIEALNSRGFREGALKLALLEHKKTLLQQLQSCPVNSLAITKEEADSAREKIVVYQSIKARSGTTQGAVKNDSAQELMELNLREMLLDIEERIHVGTLGQLKVAARGNWRDAIEQGSYDAQCMELAWGAGNVDVVPPKSPVKNGQMNGPEEEGDDDQTLRVVKDLSRALLQIEQMLEPKYLNPPLGEDETKKKKKQKAALEAAFKDGRRSGGSKKKNKTTEVSDEEADDSKNTSGTSTPRPQKNPLVRWEESLMGVTSLSQIFLHLAVLEGSVAWSKSALHARCKLCRRKGDAEKMLLCDNCDRGHHMYCLKPPVKKVPEGDWFCPACRPKDVPRTPRKSRKTFDEESDDETQEEESEEESSDEEAEEENESSEEEEADSDEDSEEEEEEEEGGDDDDDEDEDEEEEEESSQEESEEESPKPAKIRILSRGSKREPASGRSTPSSVRSSDKKSSRSKDTAASGRSRSKTKKEAVTVKGKKQETEKKRVSGRQSKQGNTPPSRNTSATRKRRASDDDTEFEPASKRGTSKSRGGGDVNSIVTAENLLQEVCQHELAWPFRKPVSKKDAPDYYEIIKTPMDFQTMKNKFNKFGYQSIAEVLQDFRSIFSNCEQYNMPDADEFQAGQKLSKFLEKRIKELKLESNKVESRKSDSASSSRRSGGRRQ